SCHRPHAPSSMEFRCIGYDCVEVVQRRLGDTVMLVEDHRTGEHYGDAMAAGGEGEVCIFCPVPAVFQAETSDALEMPGRDRETQRPEMLVHFRWHVGRQRGSCMVG